MMLTREVCLLVIGIAWSISLPLAWRIGEVYGWEAGAGSGFVLSWAVSWLAICWVQKT